MVTTRNGRELARCTLVNSRFELLYDELCVPDAPVLNYNTMYSGITRESLEGVSLRLADVQRDLLSFVDAEQTVLVGHSLEVNLV